MKVIIILALFLAMGLIFLSYKREKNTPKLLFSLAILLSIISFTVLGNMMRSLMPLFLAHIMALILSYGGLIYYIFRARAQWLLWLLPLLTLLFYVVLAWVGNEHIIWFS